MLLFMLSALAMTLDGFDSAAYLDTSDPDRIVVLPAGVDFDGMRVLSSVRELGTANGGSVSAIPLDGAAGSPLPAETLITSSHEMFGVDMDVGDLDGDGLQDLVVSNALADQEGMVHIFYGGSHTWPATDADADAILRDDMPAGGFGLRVKIIPDTTGDGLNDLVIQQITRQYVPVVGRVSALWLVPGARYAGTARIDRVPDTSRYDGETMDDVGIEISWMDDVDGDHLAEIVARRSYNVFAVLLSASRRRTQDVISGAVQLTGARQSFNIHRVMTHADVDGDGRQELLIGASGRDNLQGGDQEGGIYVVPHNLPWVPGTSVVLPPQAAQWWVPVNCSQLGQTIVGVRDVDGDGDDEVAALAVDPRTNTTKVVLLRGAPGLSQRGTHIPAWGALTRGNSLEVLSLHLAAGDADGDGWDDIVVGAFQRGSQGSPNRYGLLRFGL